jgi:methenyltetrahydromethanopterin cyclohydrolase
VKVSVNKQALEIVLEIIDRKDELNCAVAQQRNGAILVDAGIAVPGGAEVGRLIGEACMGGLGAVRLTRVHIGDLTLPAVIVGTEQPKIATLGSQYAGWPIKAEGYFAMGSGPARALAVVETKLYSELDYRDDCDFGVICLETRNPPPETVTQFIADSCHISPSNLYCLMSPTASAAGSVQISARVVEAGMHKLHMLGFDPGKVRTGYGTAPIAPVAKDDGRAMGVTNDCILYGGRTYFFVNCEECDDLGTLTDRSPSSASPQYGLPFYDLFKSVGFDFYKVDPNLFSPAEITINDVTNGRTFTAGRLNADALKQSLGM